MVSGGGGGVESNFSVQFSPKLNNVLAKSGLSTSTTKVKGLQVLKKCYCKIKVFV